MQMKDDVKNGAITQEQKISMKKDLIHENLSVRTGNNGQQVGKTKLSDNFRGGKGKWKSFTYVRVVVLRILLKGS